MPKDCCKNICDQLKRKGLAKGTNRFITYANGWLRCNGFCQISINEDAIVWRVDNTVVDFDTAKEALRAGASAWCPCCNYRMRLKPYSNTPAMLAGFARY